MLAISKGFDPAYGYNYIEKNTVVRLEKRVESCTWIFDLNGNFIGSCVSTENFETNGILSDLEELI